MSETEKRTFYCPCGKLWPCRCARAFRIMGFERQPKPGDDTFVVATATCPDCGQNALLELDPDSVNGWTEQDGRNVVNSVGGPPMGFCCDIMFVMKPGGRVDVCRKL